MARRRPGRGALNEVAAYHRALVSRLRDVIADELVGVYAGGSVALGGYEPGRSDLDVAAVCRRHLTSATKHAVVAAIRHEALPCPARGLELVVYRESVVRAPVTGAGYELDLNTGPGMPFRCSENPSEAPRHWYVVDRAILHDHGVALVGPPAGDLFAPAAHGDVLTALDESIAWHRTSGEARGDDAVLNACRAWRWADDGTWSSKRAAGEWARTRDAGTGIVSEALAARSSGDRLDADRVDAFVARVQKRLERARGTLSRS